MKAIGIVSGGLDSLLATRLVMEMGFDVLALHFVIGFEPTHLRGTEVLSLPEAIVRTGANCELVDVRQEFAKVLAQPRHGYGANLNPCIDCKIYMLSRAKEKMEELSAAFVFTGEVLGQRPMSQRMHAMQLIARESGLGEHLVRPLCGGLLPPTAPEKQGIIRRDQLESIQGRSRTAQMALAEKLGVSDYPTPAGGCLLTDPSFAKRAADLMKRRPGKILRLNDPRLLLVGRHIVLPQGSKAVIGRKEEENDVIESFSSLGSILVAEDVPGPSTLVEGSPSPEDLDAAARLTARYGKGKTLDEVTIKITSPDGDVALLSVPPNPPSDCQIL
jgi:tRNA U34 2-thiouridine synthase MnmA/TrmU